MRIFTGDHVGLLKLTDTKSKSVSFPNEAQSRPEKLNEALAITSMCFGDDDEQWLCYVRKAGTLEIISLLESDDVRPCLAIKLPAEPFLITRIKNLGGLLRSHLIIVCRTGEILQLDFLKLVDYYEKYVVKATDQFWPFTQTAKTEIDSDDKDWRLSLALSPWLSDEIQSGCQVLSLKSPEDYYPSTRPHKPNTSKSSGENENNDECEIVTIEKQVKKENGRGLNHESEGVISKKDKALLDRTGMILRDVVVGFGKLMRKKPIYIESAEIFQNVNGDWCLLLGGKKMYLRAVKVTTEGKFEITFFAGMRQDMLQKWEQLSSKCVGHLGVVDGADWIYSLDQDGRLIIYDPPHRDALIVCQTTFDKKCPSICKVLTELLEHKTSSFIDDSTADESDNSNAREQKRTNKLKRKLLIADNKGQSYILKLIYDPNSEFSMKRKKKRTESGHLEEYFVRSKKKARINPSYVPKMRTITEYRDEDTADSLYIKGHGKLLGLEGSILCAEVTPEKKSIVLGGLSRKLFIFAKPSNEWQLADKVYLKNKIYCMLISQKSNE